MTSLFFSLQNLESHLGHQVSAEPWTGCSQAVHIVPLDKSPYNLVEGGVLQSRPKCNGEPSKQLVKTITVQGQKNTF